MVVQKDKMAFNSNFLSNEQTKPSAAIKGTDEIASNT